MTIVVVAEKPSVARDIARVLGARRKAEGYLEGNGYVITWALGHLVHFAEPDDYGPQWSGRWATGQLPMIPEHWQLKTQRSTVKQFQVVKRLINGAGTEQVVCATDAGREGENIFRLIYEHARCKKPVQRLWVSSLTDEAIRDGFRRLRPGSAYDDLGQAARGRAQADWLVGMNLTRAYTVHNRVLCTIGRVQTPTLAMIVQRDAQIASFRKAFFYELVATLEEGFAAKYSHEGQTRIDDKAEAERLHRALCPHRTGTVRKNVQRERKQLRATAKGRALIGLVAEPLRSPELTAEWEQQLKEVEDGQHAAGEFYRGIVNFLRELVPRVAEGPALSPEQVAAARESRSGRKPQGGKRGGAKPADLGACPLCKEGEIVETAKAYGCSRYRDGCGFTIWKRVAGHKLAKKQVEQLLREGRTGRIEGFTSKAGKPFAAALKLGEGLKVEFDFADGPRQGTAPGNDTAPNPAYGTTEQPPAPAAARPAPEPLTCPKCGQGRIIEGRRGFGCNRYREGCDFVVWKEIGGKRLTEKQVDALIGKGKTGLLKGFKSKSGKKFDARLRVDPQWQVVFAFPERIPGSMGREKSWCYLSFGCFSEETSSCRGDYYGFFRCPVFFDSETSAVRFARSDVDRPLPAANRELARANDQILTDFLNKLRKDDLVTRVKTAIAEELPSGMPSDEEIAKTVYMSPRTLQRKLSVEGTNCSQLLDAVRRDLAEQYITDPSLSLSEISFLLGFSELSAFSRAFRRWSGQSPTVARAAADA